MKGKAIRVLWINERAELIGGAEHYIFNTVSLLNKTGIRSTLMYNVQSPVDPEFADIFEGAFPVVDIERQIAELNVNLIYLHQWDDASTIPKIVKTGITTLRFYHDYKLFCLRDHKYTTIKKETCTRPTGMHCYSCLGFINRSDSRLGVSFSRLGALQKRQHINKQIDHFIVGSTYMKEHIMAHGFEEHRITTIPLYSLSNSCDPQAPRENILFAGQLIRGKGLDTLLRAFKMVTTDQKLIVCGSGRQEAEFKSLCSQLGLDSKVEWKGKLPPEKLRTYYPSVQFVVQPSRYPETFGLVGLEAMSCGTPVIATQVGGMNEWLNDGITGTFVPSNNQEKLAHAMQHMLDNTEARQKMGCEALNSYNGNFTPDIYINKLRELIENLVQEGSHE